MSLFSANEFRRRAEAHLCQEPGDFTLFGDYRLNVGMASSLTHVKLRDAAVLIGIVEDEEAHVILTKRQDSLRKHSGQVAFPGGKIDGDEGAERAAIREAEEEIGLGQHFIDVIGAMPVIPTLSGFRITPVLATIRPGFTLAPNPDEVEHVFKVPLSFLMDAANHEQGEWERGGSHRRFYVMPYEGWHIWGITAGIIRSVYERLYE